MIKFIQNLLITHLLFWERLSNESERTLYDECGMLWLVSQDDDSYVTKSKVHIEKLGHSIEEISKSEAKKISINTF